MKTTAADVLVDTLIDWGVEVIFGLPGDGNNGIMEALRKKQDKIKFIHVRHEEAAAFMACAYSKYTKKLGVCLATSGPGGVHLLNGLYDAKLDGQSVLAITGMQFHDLVNTYAQQDVELDKLFMDVAEYNVRIMGPAHVEYATMLACRTALSRRCVSHVTFPVDFQSMPMDDAKVSKRNRLGITSNTYGHIHKYPSDSELEKAAQILNEGKKVAILAGAGAIGAGDELEKVADLLGAPIIKPLLGKMAVPDDSPFTTGGIGLLGTKPSQEAIEECDTFFMIGTSFPYLEFYPDPEQAKSVQIDIDPIRIGLRYTIDVGLVGDSAATLKRLIPFLKNKEDKGFLEKAQEGMKDWWEKMEERGTREDKPMKPQVVAWELGKLLKDDAIVSSDSGTIATWYARQIPIKKNQMCSLSGNLATMANGLPYTIAAQVAYPDRQCVALVGDGGYSMLMAEINTAVKYKLPIKIIIINNNTLGQIKWEQMVFLGNPEYGVELEKMDYAATADAMGAKGFRIEDPKDCSRVLKEALDYDGPAVVQAVVDPFEPPLPAKIEFKQAKSFAESLVRGEPNKEKIALTVAKDKVKELI